MNWRQAFLRAIHPEVYFTESEIRQWMAAASMRDGAPAAELAVQDDALAWSQRRALEFECLNLSAQTKGPETRNAVVCASLMQSAPFGLILGGWLQGMSAPGVFEDPVQLQVLSLLADDLGVGQVGHSRTSAFRALLRQWRVPLHDMVAAELPTCSEIDDCAFAFPAVLLAMSRRSDCMHVELCAIDTLLRRIGTPIPWRMLSSSVTGAEDVRRLDLAHGAHIVHEPLELSQKISLQCQSDRGTRMRFESATTWASQAMDVWTEHILHCVAIAGDSVSAMGRLLRARSREARIYHQRQLLDGCPLSEHLRNAADDPKPVLDVLARSRYVRPGQPESSPLVTGLVSSRGPMFRVFTTTELDVIREWIGQLPASATSSAPKPLRVHVAPPPASDVRDESDHRPLDIRDAYFRLQGRALHPSLRLFAIEYVRRWLHNARRRSTNATERALPTQWGPATLGPWLLSQHDLHGQAFEKLQLEAEIPNREAVIDSTLQLAPLILIDGAWLQSFTDVCLAGEDSGAPLFEIYWDELGNGQPALNHPRIYRDLLCSMGITLAATGSRQFATDPRLGDESFELPVLWLCLGKLPMTFRAEVLGINLAMELSGVGDGYREAKKFLAHHGFSTQFVELHNTIDNVATGHSAWAVDAIERHMSKIASLGNVKAVAAEWDRIRTGYSALTTRPSALQRQIQALSNAVRKWSSPQAIHASPPLHHHSFGTS